MIIFSDALEENNVLLKPLVYKSTVEHNNILNDFLQQYVFSSLQEESHDETRIEELHKKRSYLAGFCKLIIYNIFPTRTASDIFKHYLRVSHFYINLKFMNVAIFNY